MTPFDDAGLTKSWSTILKEEKAKRIAKAKDQELKAEIGHESEASSIPQLMQVNQENIEELVQ